MKKLISAVIVAAMLLSLLSFIAVIPAAAAVEGMWNVYSVAGDYYLEDKEDDEFAAVPGYEYTDEGLRIIPADWSEHTPRFGVQTKDIVDLKEGVYFDIKQMICHLLGIATGMLNGTLERKQTDFIYLLYDPTDLDIEPDAKETIDAIYKRTCYECNLIDFAELYRVIIDFLREEFYTISTLDDDVDAMVIGFVFTLTSHELYPDLLT